MNTGEHEWTQVLNRRWCLTCSAFQSRRSENEDWRPLAPAVCPFDTAYAERKTSRLVPEARIKQLRFHRLVVVLEKDERRILIETAARELASTLFEHDKVLIQRRERDGMIELRLDVEIIVPEGKPLSP